MTASVVNVKKLVCIFDEEVVSGSLAFYAQLQAELAELRGHAACVRIPDESQFIGNE